VRKAVYKDERSPRMRNNERRALSCFFAWCEAENYCARNPVKAVRPPKVKLHGEPASVGLGGSRALLRAARDYEGGVLIPWLSLALFAGLRPKELERITWADISLEEKTIALRVAADTSSQRRIVDLADNLVEWLRPHAGKKSAIHPTGFRRHFRKVRETAGFKLSAKADAGKLWVADMPRHSALTYKYAECQEEGETTKWAGNSVAIFHKHYKALVRRVDAAKYWLITPANGDAEIIQRPEAKDFNGWQPQRPVPLSADRKIGEDDPRGLRLNPAPL